MKKLFAPKPKPFQTGQLIVTDAVVDAMEDPRFRSFVYACYIRYCSNDWGDLDKTAFKENRRNIKHGGNLGGYYIDEVSGRKVVILTPAQRDRTVVCMADEK